MTIVDLHKTAEEIRACVKHETTAYACDLVGMNSFGMDNLKVLVRAILDEYDSADLTEELFVTIMELGNNAVRANYSFMHALDKVKVETDRQELTYTDLTSPENFELYDNAINSQELKQNVKRIIREEGILRTLLSKLAREGREPEPAECSDIEEKSFWMNRAQTDGVRAGLILSTTHSRISIDVFNDAPITNRGRERIYSKRRTFRDYFDHNRIGDFYLENLDQTESAGFGAAMIDSRLLKWGMEPMEHFNVFNIKGRTFASITLVF